MIDIKDKADCSGCTACESICPKGAIDMKADAMGFLYPEIDLTRCVDCGLCEKVCAFNEDYDTSLNLPQPIIYGARHRRSAEIDTSRSGATFIAISDFVLEQGGVVYGVGWGEHFRVLHKRATTPIERDEFKGSKYVQSDLRGIFKQVRNDLHNGLTVLFSGTPCQTAGLHSFVGKELRSKLVLVDIVCHGVPGPKVWEEYLLYLEKREGKPLKKVNFRDKSVYGWSDHKETYDFKGRNGPVTKMVYTFLFYRHIMFRKSCAKCHYTNIHRPSDITLADFWGWEKTDLTFNSDDRGASLVMLNTEKGKEIFEAVNTQLNTIHVDIEKCMQPNLKKPSEFDPKRDDFERDFAQKGFRYVLYKYGNEGWRYKVKIHYRRFRHLTGCILRYIHLK